MFAPGTHLLLVSFLLVLATFYLVYRSHRFEGSSLLQIDRHQTRYTSKYTSKRIAMWAGCAPCESNASWNDKRLDPLKRDCKKVASNLLRYRASFRNLNGINTITALKLRNSKKRIANTREYRGNTERIQREYREKSRIPKTGRRFSES